VLVTAETLFEAAVLALIAFGNAGGAPGQAARLTIKAPVATHTVSMQQLNAY
jgi:hypothetical protein